MVPKNPHVLDSFPCCDWIAEKTEEQRGFRLAVSGKTGCLASGLRWKRTSWEEPVEVEAAHHGHSGKGPRTPVLSGFLLFLHLNPQPKRWCHPYLWQVFFTLNYCTTCQLSLKCPHRHVQKCPFLVFQVSSNPVKVNHSTPTSTST